ncbi:MBL fold metallo-hydrolase [Chloroflexota bacterium]
MKIKWLGHAAFLITSDDGTRIITDPYMPNERLAYDEIEESADIVTVSHGHGDHNNVAVVQGNPQVVKGTAGIRGIKFNSIPTYHDNVGGSQRGNNTVFCFEVDGIRLCHLGDLGHQLGDKDVALMGRVDILLVPVGGDYTIDAKVATEVCSKLAPKVIIPMHFRNERCPSFPVAGVDDFLQNKAGVNRLDTNEVEFKRGEFPAAAQIIVFRYCKKTAKKAPKKVFSVQ